MPVFLNTRAACSELPYAISTISPVAPTPSGKDFWEKNSEHGHNKKFWPKKIHIGPKKATCNKGSREKKCD